MMEDYWLTWPPEELDEETECQLEELWQQTCCNAAEWLPDQLPVEKWLFLCWLVERKGFLLHGSADASINAFEPRKPSDRSPDDFSKQTAVFAAGDALWAIFYAILDRTRPGLRFLNAALEFELQPGQLSPLHYFFSVSNRHLDEGPWSEGVVYVLPADGFVQQPPHELNGRVVHEPHYANPNMVRPLAKIAVAPHDFPFLQQVRGHDSVHIDKRAANDPYGFPWLTS
jgi:hypothetical protein